jgi:arylsulfatase A-like enzyme
MRNAYTQYAGTSLSEPAIWSGALLLHAHYLQPFDKVNSLKKLLKTDGYQMIVSYDEVLQQVLPEDPDLLKLDTGILWNHLEISSSLLQLEAYLDARKEKDRPIFFYTQPKNVHQFGVNDRPKRTSSNWKDRPGLNNRIAYAVHQVDESIGPFFDYLKAKDLYDNSIIVVTADHGDATGGFGLFTHSTFITPEIMRVPLIIHLPRRMRQAVSYDPKAISALTDLTPSLYYLLGHGTVRKHPLIGQPLFTSTKEELDGYSRTDLFLASDSRAGYGLLMDHGTRMFVTYDSPAQGKLYDMRESVESPLAESVKGECERRIVRYLQDIADFYSYKPTGG